MKLLLRAAAASLVLPSCNEIGGCGILGTAILNREVQVICPLRVTVGFEGRSRHVGYLDCCLSAAVKLVPRKRFVLVLLGVLKRGERVPDIAVSTD